MKILILGVGSAQLDAILYLKDKGYEVHGLSYKNEGRGIQFVDKFEVINIVDKERVAEYAKMNKIDVVYSVGSDIAMPTVGYISKTLRIPYFVSEKTAELLQDKSLFRKFIHENQLSPVPHVTAMDLSDVDQWNIYPSIIKPVDGQGQRGIYELESKEDLEKYFSKALENSRKGKVIIEKYIQGQEISVNAYVYNGEIIYNFISTRETVRDYPGGIVKGHIMPVSLSKKLEANVNNLVKNTIDKLEIKNGPVYFQMKYQNDEVYIIEATGRLDGCHIWRLINEVYGINLLDLAFNHLINKDIGKIPAPSFKRELELSFFLNKPGSEFTKNEYKVLDCAIYSEFYYSNKEIIRPINGHMDKVGYQIIENN